MNPSPDPPEGHGESATVYVAFDLPPGTMPDGLPEIRHALADAARRITATGRPVRYLNGMYMPAKTRLLCVFAADREQDVRDAAALVGLPFTEIGTVTGRPERCRDQ